MLRNSRNRWHAALRTMLLAFSVVSVGFCGALVSYSGIAEARTPFTSAPAETMAVSQLPPQGRNVLALIHQGGPFRHDKDGVVFGNREKQLAAKDRGYYREYTVRTPGEGSRGARRIVCGGLRATAPDACFYTDDHYASFRKIVP